MDCQRPVKNKETNMWEVWDFAYQENGERYYELHKFFTHKEAIEFWKVRNPKLNAT
jgi:hypothetical protein